MPNTKCSDVRYKVLDRCLRRGGYSTTQLMEEVNKELEFQGFPLVTASNTIRQDLSYIGATYPEIIIKQNKSGRNVTYGYENPESSIFKLALSDDELAQLSQCMAILSRFNGLPQMDWLSGFLERFKLSINIDVDGKLVVGFDECSALKGKSYFSTLVSAICNKEVLAIGYKSFSNPTGRERIVHPYYIKEYNKRWFLIGTEHGYDSPSTYAFDRIEYINKVSGIAYQGNNSIDFNNDYFADIVGVTRHTKAQIENIRLFVANNLYPYIKTKPIHPTQKEVNTDEEGVEIEINVRPNYELEQLILSYGEGLKVLSPDSLKSKIEGRIKKSLENYELVHKG